MVLNTKLVRSGSREALRSADEIHSSTWSSPIPTGAEIGPSAAGGPSPEARPLSRKSLETPSLTALFEDAEKNAAALRTADVLEVQQHPVDVFNVTVQAGTRLHLPQMGVRPPQTMVPMHAVKRRPGGLLKDAVGGNVRLTKVRLGSGVRGDVVVCFNERTRELMAAKKSLVSTVPIKYVMHEAQAYRLGHSMLTPFAILVGPKKTYMLQALCSGSVHSLLHRLEPAERSKARIALALIAGRQTAAALRILHEGHIAHRDIKPDNLLYLNDTVYLADYDRAVADHARFSRNQTANLMPTLDYAPPEAFALAPSDDFSKVDIWSLGASLLEIATGFDKLTRPMRQEVAAVMLAKLIRQQLPRDGAYEACYAACTDALNYEPLEKLTQAVLTRAMMLVHDRVLGSEGPPAELPAPNASCASSSAPMSWDSIPADDPIRLIPDDLRLQIQNCYLESMRALPMLFRTVVRSMLQPDPARRLSAGALIQKLNLSIMDTVCHVDEGKRLLVSESARAAEKLRTTIMSDARPGFWKHVTRCFTA